MTIVWCVAWWPDHLPRKLRTEDTMEWCATFRGVAPPDSYFSMRTSCGMSVILPVGAEKRTPTCSTCKQRVAKRRSARWVRQQGSKPR